VKIEIRLDATPFEAKIAQGYLGAFKVAFFKKKMLASDMARGLSSQTFRTAREILDEFINNNSVYLTDGERNSAMDELAISLYFGVTVAFWHLRPVRKIVEIADLYKLYIRGRLGSEVSNSHFLNRLEQYSEAWNKIWKAEEGEGAKNFATNLLSNILPAKYQSNPELNMIMAGLYMRWMETLRLFFRQYKIT
jgi:hypothetical protein